MGWGEQKLSLLCDMFTDGDWVESKDQSPEGVRLIQTGNVGEGVFKERRDKSRFISEETFSRLKCTEILEGDCLVSRLPDPVGRSCLIPFTGEKMITAVDCTIIRLNRSHLLPEFFNYFTQSYTYLTVVESLTSGATRKRISRKNLGEVPIPLPPISEQQRIVAILDQAFADIEKARANAEKNLKNARELFDSYLNQVFSQRGEGWVESELGKLGQITSSKRIFKSEYVDAGVPFFRTKEIKQLANGKTISTELFISEEKYNQIKTRFDVPAVGDVLITAIGTIGEIYVVDNAYPFYFKDGNVLWLKQFNTLKPQFLKYALMAFVSELNRLSRGAAYNALPIQKLKCYVISFPQISEQDEVISKIDAIKDESQKLVGIYSQKIASLEELKKSLLQKAFSGELTKTTGHAA